MFIIEIYHLTNADNQCRLGSEKLELVVISQTTKVKGKYDLTIAT